MQNFVFGQSHQLLVWYRLSGYFKLCILHGERVPHVRSICRAQPFVHNVGLRYKVGRTQGGMVLSQVDASSDFRLVEPYETSKNDRMTGEIVGQRTTGLEISPAQIWRGSQ